MLYDFESAEAQKFLSRHNVLISHLKENMHISLITQDDLLFIRQFFRNDLSSLGFANLPAKHETELCVYFAWFNMNQNMLNLRLVSIFAEILNNKLPSIYRDLPEVFYEIIATQILFPRDKDQMDWIESNDEQWERLLHGMVLYQPKLMALQICKAVTYASSAINYFAGFYFTVLNSFFSSEDKAAINAAQIFLAKVIKKQDTFSILFLIAIHDKNTCCGVINLFCKTHNLDIPGIQNWNRIAFAFLGNFVCDALIELVHDNDANALSFRLSELIALYPNLFKRVFKQADFKIALEDIAYHEVLKLKALFFPDGQRMDSDLMMAYRAFIKAMPLEPRPRLKRNPHIVVAI
jgi:hypothetical protein